MFIQTIHQILFKFSDWNVIEQQRSDADLATLLYWIETRCKSPLWRLHDASPYLKNLWAQFGLLFIHNGVLCRHLHNSFGDNSLQVVIPTLLIPEIHPWALFSGSLWSGQISGQSYAVLLLSLPVFGHFQTFLSVCCLSVSEFSYTQTTSTTHFYLH